MFFLNIYQQWFLLLIQRREIFDKAWFGNTIVKKSINVHVDTYGTENWFTQFYNKKRKL